MLKLNYKVSINASPYRVWQTLWQDKNYRQWSSLFSENSYAISDWKEGSKTQFLTPEGEGMYSIIEKSILNELMIFKHLGVIKKFIEQPNDPETKKWSGSKESYVLVENDKGTILNVSLDSIDDFKEFFDDIFPKALDKIKSIAEAPENAPIIIETSIKASMEKVWAMFTKPEHIMSWYNASDDWYAPAAENDLKTGGKFKTTMAAKDGSFSFDFEGTYTKVKEFENIDFKIIDGRVVKIQFKEQGDEIRITESFEPEDQNARDVQKKGWQAILNNFKKYVENSN